MATPIWKDFEVTLGTGDYAEYTIRTSTSATDTIYTGKAWKKPGETSVKIIINDICADYMRQSLPDISTTGLKACNTYNKTFFVYVGDTQKASVLFWLDYSYDYAIAGNDYLLSDPIDGELDYRMPIIHTMRYNTGTVDYGRASFNSDFNFDFDILPGVTIVGWGNYVHLLTSADIDRDIRIIELVGETNYHIIDSCAKFALYYVNEYGGWDALVMKGGYKKVDKYKRYEMKRSYNNAVASNRGRFNYANEETFSYDLRTALLSDSEASRMHHLLGSTMVYMYDLETGILQPVVITDNSCEYKTYKNNGLKMSQYTIEVEIAKDQTRR